MKRKCTCINWACRYDPLCEIHGTLFHKNPEYKKYKKKENMTYSVGVEIMPLKELLDPQGKVVKGVLNNNLGFEDIQDVRIGKNIILKIEASSEEQAIKIAEDASKKLLVNLVMENFEISIIS